MQFDFRNIYSTVLTDWLGPTKAESNTILFNEFDVLPIFKQGCAATLSVEKFEINIFPNSAIDFIHIEFNGNNEQIKITLYNTIGIVVKEITNKKYSALKHTLNID